MIQPRIQNPVLVLELRFKKRPRPAACVLGVAAELRLCEVWSNSGHCRGHVMYSASGLKGVKGVPAWPMGMQTNSTARPSGGGGQ